MVALSLRNAPSRPDGAGHCTRPVRAALFPGAPSAYAAQHLRRGHPIISSHYPRPVSNKAKPRLRCPGPQGILADRGPGQEQTPLQSRRMRHRAKVRWMLRNAREGRRWHSACRSHTQERRLDVMAGSSLCDLESCRRCPGRPAVYVAGIGTCGHSRPADTLLVPQRSLGELHGSQR